MILTEILSKVPEGKFVVVGLHANSVLRGEGETSLFIEGPAEEDNFYESFAEARAVAQARWKHPQNTADWEFHSQYWVYDHKGNKLHYTG